MTRIRTIVFGIEIRTRVFSGSTTVRIPNYQTGTAALYSETIPRAMRDAPVGTYTRVLLPDRI